MKLFNEYVDYFLYTVKSIDIAETTMVAYETICNHLKSYFFEVYIEEIKKSDIQNYFKKLLEREYLPGKFVSINTVRKHYDFLNQIFKEAITDELIEFNPIEKIKKPKLNEYYCEVYSEMECFVLLKLVKEQSFNLYIPVLFSIFLGLRRGEICGLKWKHIDLLEQTVIIKDTRTTAAGKIVSKATKTKKSVRKKHIPDFLNDVLKQEKERQIDFIQSEIENSHVCVYIETGEALKPHYITNQFPIFLLRNKLKKIRFHDLRHTCASIANKEGATLKDISDLLGHSSSTITSKLYIHLFDDTQKAAISKIEQSILKFKDEI